MKKDAEILTKIVELISTGVSYRNAALAVGIGKTTLARWKQEDQEFRASLKRAEAQAHARAVKCISDQWDKNWQSAAWWLERRYPERYAKRAMPPMPEPQPPLQNCIVIDLGKPPKQPFEAKMDDYRFIMDEMTRRGVAPFLVEHVREYLTNPIYEIFSDGIPPAELLGLVKGDLETKLRAMKMDD